MRVLIVTPEYPPHTGGIEQVRFYPGLCLHTALPKKQNGRRALSRGYADLASQHPFTIHSPFSGLSGPV